MRSYKTQCRTISTLAIGEFVAYESIKKCAFCKKTYGSDELKITVPPKAKFGFDVIAYIGQSMFQENKNEIDIQRSLLQKNITISIREIGYLAKKFVIYLALLHNESQHKIKKLMYSNGGYILL